jgi:predicted AAA+ superfamily ATPase
LLYLLDTNFGNLIIFVFGKTLVLEFLQNLHASLIESPGKFLERRLRDQIDWEHRMICIKGFRGIGKTTFILDYIRNEFGNDRSVLYVNLNNFYFTKRKLFSFADEFSKRGGKVLFLDQINKYPGWSEELRKSYDQIPGLKIIFTASPILRVSDENPDLKGIVKIYYLDGLSFREYLQYKTGEIFPVLDFEEILNNHIALAKSVVEKVKPLAYFSDYLKHGYYPYFIENPGLFENTLLKNINLALEIDIPYINQVDLKYLSKLRKLLYIISSETPFSPNVSKLASSIQTSRATVMNYLKYLRNARLIQLLYHNCGGDEAKKPAKVYMHNTNLLYAIMPENSKSENVRHTFFINQLYGRKNVKSSSFADFMVDNQFHFKVGGSKTDPVNDCYAAADMIEIGKENKMPLWLFGFIY